MIERAGDIFMASVGFTAFHFSQARATQQTPGIPDRLYVCAARQLAVWWEAKTEVGKQSIYQAFFERQCRAVGWTYLVGTDTVLHDYAVSAGLVERLANGFKVRRVAGGARGDAPAGSESPSS